MLAFWKHYLTLLIFNMLLNILTKDFPNLQLLIFEQHLVIMQNGLLFLAV